MSINPVLGKDAANGNELFPMPQAGEIFVLRREGIAFSGESSDKKLTGKGKLFLTSNRLVFLRDGDPAKHKNFTGVELPLHLLSGESRNEAPNFKQPFFGANYLEGRVEPVENAPHPLMGTTKFRLTFNQGGCQTFLRAFFRLHKAAVRNPGVGAVDPAFAAQINLGPQAAFYDPTDPSVIYVTQPQPVGGMAAGQPPYGQQQVPPYGQQQVPQMMGGYPTGGPGYPPQFNGGMMPPGYFPQGAMMNGGGGYPPNVGQPGIPPNLPPMGMPPMGMPGVPGGMSGQPIPGWSYGPPQGMYPPPPAPSAAQQQHPQQQQPSSNIGGVIEGNNDRMATTSQTMYQPASQNGESNYNVRY